MNKKDFIKKYIYGVGNDALTDSQEAIDMAKDLDMYFCEQLRQYNVSGQLVAGLVVSKGNFKLKKKIETLDEFWRVINTEKSLYFKNKMYPTAFFFSWQIKNINRWISAGYFWIAEPCR